MHFPEKLIDRRLFTTIPSFQLEYVQITMVKWQGKTAQWLPHRPRVAAIHAASNSSHLWSQHIFQELGNETAREGNNNIESHSSLASDKINTLTAWTQKVPIRPDDAFEAPAASTTVAEVPLPRILGQKDYIKSRRTIKGQPQIAADLFQTLPQPPPIKEPYMPTTPAKPTKTSASATPTQTQTDTSPIVPMYRKGPLIDLPELVSFAQQGPSLARPVPRWASAQKIARKPDEELLQEIQRPTEFPESVIDSLQLVEESQDRQYGRGAKLKTSKTAALTDQGRFIISRVTEAAMTILELARPSCARLTLDVMLGCVYIKRSDLAKDIQSRPFGDAEWSSAFQTRNGTGKAPTTFSKTYGSPDIREHK